MNLQALYAYGAGISVGLVWSAFYSKTSGFWMNFTVFVILTMCWPLIVFLILNDWRKGRPMVWSKDE